MITEFVTVVVAIGVYGSVQQMLRYVNIDGDEFARTQAKRRAEELPFVVVASGVIFLTFAIGLPEALLSMVPFIGGVAAYDTVRQSLKFTDEEATLVARRRAKREALIAAGISGSGVLFMLFGPSFAILPLALPAYITANRLLERRDATGRFL